MTAYRRYKKGEKMEMVDPVGDRPRCPKCGTAMRRAYTNYGQGWVFDCKCQDSEPETQPEFDPAWVCGVCGKRHGPEGCALETPAQRTSEQK